ncbi:MAG: DNA internalization-related competence protein ComEC/Rec2 [Lachnospiraceae bacterium]|nr:DNA internalization-related competence protein ComEC/Rec2 [Lachnospiraceae bacterium]
MRKRPLACACLLLTLLFYLAVNLFSPPVQGQDMEGKVRVTGRIYQKELRMQAESPVLVLYLKDLSGVSPPGKAVICYLKSGQKEPEMGSRVTVEGSYRTFERASNPGQFDSYSYYLASGISYRLNQAIILEKTVTYSKVGEGLYRIRKFLSDKLSESLAEEESALMRTILLGEKWELDREVKELYQRNGIAHILAISGLHVSMLGMGLYHLLRKSGISMKLSAVLASVLLVLYGVMTGFSVSAVRAILMFSLHMLAIVTERTYDLLTALSVSAVILLVTQPLYVNYSGFVFSFGCVLGIALLTPALTEGEGGIFERKKSILTAGVKGILSACSMGVVTLPIYLWYYYQFPLWSVLLNLLVIPLMSYLMAAGILLLAVSIICPSAVGPLTVLIRGIFRIFESACAVSEKLPAHLVNFGRPQAWQMFLYLAVLLLVIRMKKKVTLPVRWLAAAFGVLILLVRPGGELEITFLDVGQGDGIYVETAEGERFLVDGGSSSVGSVGKYRLIPFLQFQGTRRLDAVFVTHPDTDHCNGIKEILEQGEDSGIYVDWLVLPDIEEESKSDEYKSLVEAAKQNHVPVTYISRGQKLQRGELTITCLHPQKGYETEDANAYSMVLELDYGNFSALLTGDLEGTGEQSFLEYQKKREENQESRSLTVLKAAHHGSKYSTTKEFLEMMNPSIAVISAGKGNSYGHPHEELLKRLQEQGCLIYQTSESGAVTVRVKNDRVEVEEFLGSKIELDKKENGGKM